MRYSDYEQSKMDSELAEQDDKRLADIRRKAATCRDKGGEVGRIGECLKCDAEQGIACRASAAKATGV